MSGGHDPKRRTGPPPLPPDAHTRTSRPPARPTDPVLHALDDAFDGLPRTPAPPPLPRARRGSAVHASLTPRPTPAVSPQMAVALGELVELREENARLWELVRLVREVRRLEETFERRGSRQSDFRAFQQARNRLDAILLELLGG